MCELSNEEKDFIINILNQTRFNLTAEEMPLALARVSSIKHKLSTTSAEASGAMRVHSKADTVKANERED